MLWCSILFGLVHLFNLILWYASNCFLCPSHVGIFSVPWLCNVASRLKTIAYAISLPCRMIVRLWGFYRVMYIKHHVVNDIRRYSLNIFGLSITSVWYNQGLLGNNLGTRPIISIGTGKIDRWQWKRTRNKDKECNTVLTLGYWRYFGWTFGLFLILLFLQNF